MKFRAKEKGERKKEQVDLTKIQQATSEKNFFSK